MTDSIPSLDSFVEGPLSDRYEEGAGARAVLRKLVQEPLDARGAGRTRRCAELTLSPNAPLFSYQQEIVDSLRHFLSAGKRLAMVSLPTGGGKTRTGLWFYREQVRAGKMRRLLWVAPALELVDQAVDAMQDLWCRYMDAPTVRVLSHDIRSLRGARSVDGVAVFATVQLAVKRPLAVHDFSPDLVVVDEAHQASARTCSSMIRRVVEECDSAVVGLSATPGRSAPEEEDDLRAVFHDNLIVPREFGTDPVGELRRRGVLAKLHFERIQLPRQWDKLRVTRPKQKALSTDELAANGPRFWATVNTVTEIAARAKCLLFGASVAHCYALAGALINRGVQAAVLYHLTPLHERQRTLDLFRAGLLDVILNKRILSTGFDCPDLADLVIATPIRSPILWEQVVGRASRGPAVGGTEVSRIWELDDHRALHQRTMAYRRFAGNQWS